MKRATPPKFQATQRKNSRRNFRECNFRRQKQACAGGRGAVSIYLRVSRPITGCNVRRSPGETGKRLVSFHDGLTPYHERVEARKEANPYRCRTLNTNAPSLSLSLSRCKEWHETFPPHFLFHGVWERDFQTGRRCAREQEHLNATPILPRGRSDNARHD